MLKIKLHPLYNMDGAIGDSPSVEGTDETVSTGTAPEQETPESTIDSAEKDSSFAKRLREHSEKAVKAEREKWESEQSEKYKDHDTYKKATEYLQKTTQISDLLTLREEIELAELQERAEKEQVPAAVMKRIDQLEAKAAKADEMEASAKQQEEWQSFETNLKTFSEGKELDGKPLDHKELWSYMHDNEVSKPEIAYKAMKADLLEAKLETARTDAVNDYLKSKQVARTDGSTGAAAQTIQTGGGFKGAEQRAADRMRAAREAQ